MEVKELTLKNSLLLTPRVFHDGRGFFFESFKPRNEFPPFVQENHSYSKKGVIRGMHFQVAPHEQAKLIRVACGKIYDVFVDLRKDSPTYKQWQGILLDDVSHEQLFIPPGFAHGFQVLSDEAHVLYKVSALYAPECERSFRFDDPDLGITWPLPPSNVSEKDLKAPFIREYL